MFSLCQFALTQHITLPTAAFLTQTVALDDSTVKFEIWDTAGQERYRSLAPMYYRGAAAAIVVYDITNPDSFAGAKSWVKELQRRGDQNVVIAMVSTDTCFMTLKMCGLRDTKQTLYLLVDFPRSSMLRPETKLI